MTDDLKTVSATFTASSENWNEEAIIAGDKFVWDYWDWWAPQAYNGHKRR